MGSVGAQIPLDRDANSTYYHYNVHVDYTFARGLALFLEINGIHWLSSGDGKTTVHLADGTRLSLSDAQRVLGSGRFEGFYFANLGSEGVAGNDMVTGAVGVRYQVSSTMSVGLSYERPITQRKDLMKERLTFMATFEF